MAPRFDRRAWASAASDSGQYLVDDEADLVGHEEVQDLSHGGLVVGAGEGRWQTKTHGSTLLAEAGQGQRGRLITGVAIVHQHAKGRQAAHALHRHVAPHGLQGELDADALCQTHHFGLKILRGIVDRHLRSQAAGQCQFGLGGCRGNAPEAPLFAQLNQHCSHA